MKYFYNFIWLLSEGLGVSGSPLSVINLKSKVWWVVWESYWIMVIIVKQSIFSQMQMFPFIPANVFIKSCHTCWSGSNKMRDLSEFWVVLQEKHCFWPSSQTACLDRRELYLHWYFRIRENHPLKFPMDPPLNVHKATWAVYHMQHTNQTPQQLNVTCTSFHYTCKCTSCVPVDDQSVHLSLFWELNVVFLPHSTF